jgi:endonuclease-8
MPEGPEIRRAADRIARAVVDQPLTAVEFAFPHLQHYQAQLSASRVIAVEPRSKALLTRFACGLTIYSHNQLYGVWKITRAGREPSTRRSLRLAICTESQQALLYSASDISVWSDDEIEAHPYIGRLGPDPLRAGVGTARIARQLENKRFARRTLGDLLLDQSFVAGIGNYLRSEILFRAGLRPERRLGNLDKDERARLAKQTLDTVQRAYQRSGVTLDLPISARIRRERKLAMPAELYADGPKRRDHHRFWVFEREGLPCHRCATPIAREEVAGRRLYFCPRCQV